MHVLERLKTKMPAGCRRYKEKTPGPESRRSIQGTEAAGAGLCESKSLFREEVGGRASACEKAGGLAMTETERLPASIGGPAAIDG